jgi:phosphatidylserine/phosphatidylglycerophosphate/cardiolipin synthase-like enzyme
MQGLIGVINKAQRSLDIAIYEMDLDPIGDALLAARQRGVAVRLVTDSDTLEVDETLIRLEKAGLPIIPDERNPIMHNKFVVVDGQAVWTGSWNFTVNDTYRNNNHSIYIQSPQLAQNYAAEFEEMFSNKAFGPTSTSKTPFPRLQVGQTPVEVCFAPEDRCADQLIVLIRQAQQSIRFMAFSFTHAEIGKAVIDRAKVGVTVQGVFETRGSDTDSSQLARMKRQKLDVWQDGNPYTLHHKVFIIDDKIVVLGSFNFSDNADSANDENMLVIHSPALAGQFLAEFNRVYAQAQSAQ